MGQSKIEFRLGGIHFIGEGEKEWVTKQLDKMISRIPELLHYSEEGDAGMPASVPSGTTKKSGKRGRPSSAKSKKSELKPQVNSVKSSAAAKHLAPFIQSKKAGANQRIKFLATAVFLNKNGKSNLVTRDISRALKDARIPSLINPSQYLNQNVKQGFLKRSGDHFVLTKKGESAI
ncbi:MAG: hypothetical protein NT126_04930 [Bacteroidetes bacterium]|nr:hypothetical protein [Bacteroidota bacterium]